MNEAIETRTVDHVTVRISGSDDAGIAVTDKEISAYIQRGNRQRPSAQVDELDLNIDGEFVDITYHYAAAPFDRIRRITGYLVGTLDRFNDAKRAEEADRVKHSVSCSCCE